jgi:Glucodextranase, domain B
MKKKRARMGRSKTVLNHLLRRFLACAMVLGWASVAFGRDFTSHLLPADTEILPLTTTDIHQLNTLSDDQLTVFGNLLNETPTISAGTLASNHIHGNFLSLQNPNWPPLPGDMNGLPVWPCNGFFLVDDLNYTPPVSLRMGMMADASPFPGAGSGSGSGGEVAFYSIAFDRSQLWLNLTNVANGISYLNLFNATNQVYAILSTTDLLSGWQVETEVWPTDTNCMPFTVATLNRANLFLRAEDWTGVTENGNTTPDWWFWLYFGTTSLSDTNLDSQGNTLLSDYQNGQDPNVIQFNLTFTRQYINTPTGTAQLNVSAGVPSFAAVLINDTNMADAVWLPYPGTNVTVATPTDGVYHVSIGLRGLPATGTPTWQDVTFVRDTNPPMLLVTNLTGLSGSRPFIDPAGYSSKALHQITCTLVDANGNTNNSQAFVFEQGLNPWAPYYVTNWFQCLDLPLTEGTNQVWIQAVDWAGNVAVTNFAYVFDTNGDTTPPAITLVWPQNGTRISGNTFTVQGTVDDDTASAALQYTDTNGNVQTVNGLVERGGNLWVENVPLSPGTNSISISAVDAAGNVSTTNINVVQSDLSLTVTPLDGGVMNSAYATVYGTVSDPDCTILVNGIPGTNNGDGTWEVDNVPLPPGGTVALVVTAQPEDDDSSQALEETDRSPVVYTDTYQRHLYYQMLDLAGTPYGIVTNGTETHDITMAWGKGKGGTLTDNSAYNDYANDSTSTSLKVTTWPADDGYMPSLPGQQIVSITSSSSYGVYSTSYTNSVGPPSVEWMEQSAASGALPYDFDTMYGTSSSRQVKLFTGGKAMRQKQGLFDLSSAVNRESGVDGNVPDWDFLFNEEMVYGSQNSWHFQSTGLPVPPDEISLGGLGSLGEDGNLWKILPDGKGIDITPSAPVTSFVGNLPGQQKYVLTHQTAYPALTDTNLARLNLGVGEYVYFDGMPDETSWTASGGGLSSTNGSSMEFTAASNACSATVTADCHGQTLSTTFAVLAPSGVDNSHTYITSTFTNLFILGQIGAKMHLNVYLAPTYVSFYRVHCVEVGQNATKVWGVFTNVDPAIISHRGGPGLGKGDEWFQIGVDNSWEHGTPGLDWDTCFLSWDSCPGGYTWIIPGQWKIDDGPTNNIANGWSQVFSIDSSGTTQIEKFNRTVRRDTNNVTTPSL